MSVAALDAHLKTGVTSVARCWRVTRRDGPHYGFTDHDQPLLFDGTEFKAESGLTAYALSQTTGLSVDNSEAMGALSDVAVTEQDIIAGRYDGAVVEGWLVNWQDPQDRVLQFRGTLGEFERQGGAFKVELRGLAEAMNRQQGRIYQSPCPAVLGDTSCGVDLSATGYRVERTVEIVTDNRVLEFEGFNSYEPRWFEKGRFTVLSGAASGLIGVIKNDRYNDNVRSVELWEQLRLPIAPGDMIRLEAGCDRRLQTCKLKFNNIHNYQGFPDVPGDDWMVSYPARSPLKDGGSLR